MTKFIQKSAVLLAAICAAGSISALPVIDRVLFFTDFYGSSVTFPTRLGGYLNLDTRVISPDAPELISAVARQGDLIQPLSFYSDAIFTEKNFNRRFRNFSLTGAWDLTVTDSSGSVAGIFPAIADPELLPLLQNVQIFAHGLTPTVTWELPDLSGFDADFIRVRAIEAATSRQIFQSAFLDLSSGSFTFDRGVLSEGVSYEFRLLLDDFDGFRLENRSNTFSSIYTATAVPEPSALMLMLAGAGLLGLVGRQRSNSANSRPTKR